MPGSGDTVASKSQLQNRLKRLEAARAALPDEDEDLAPERESLTSPVADTKRQLHGS